MLLASISAVAQVQVKTRLTEFAHAIAMQEGFYVKGSVAQRFHNPGNIRTRLAHAYPGQVRVTPHHYAVFASEKYGWRALEHNLDKIYNDESRYYNRDMSIAQIAKIYARDPNWVINVCHILNVSPETTFANYIDSEKGSNVQETKPDAVVIGAAYHGAREGMDTSYAKAVPCGQTLYRGGESQGGYPRVSPSEELPRTCEVGSARSLRSYSHSRSDPDAIQSALRSPPDRGVPRDA